ncbi:MAG: bacterial Ig-like domain-containing protein [Clostridia bacterium]|nr:bacterial Ig-like domain-containing protein [Clostridia bacterium]
MRGRTVTIILCTLMLAMSLLFAACEMPSIEGIEVTAQPKLTYNAGEAFDATGLEVSRVLSNGYKYVIDDYVIDAPEAVTPQDNKVTIIHNGFTTEIELTVLPIQVEDVEIKFAESLESQGNLSLDAILFRPVYSNDTVEEEWTSVAAEDVVSHTIENGVLTLNLKIFAKNAFVEKQVTMDLSEMAISVSQLLAKTEPYTYLLKGRLVGIGYTNVTEFLIAEESTGAVIGVSGLAGSGTFADLNVDLKGFEIGDEVLVPVNLATAAITAGSANSGKLFARYDSSAMIPATKLSHSDDFTISKANAVTISTQEELREFLSAENRPGNAYKMVRLVGKINLITYTKNFVRFFFDGVDSYAEQKIDGVNCSPVFHNPAQHYTCGENFGSMAFGDEDFTSTSWTNPKYMNREVYAIFIGGTTWYHYFTILNEDDISRGDVTQVEFTAPNIDNYALGTEFDLSGGKFTVKYEFGDVEEVELTMDMLDPTTIPDTNVEGDYTVKASYLGREFTFDVSVLDKRITSIALENPLTGAPYDYVNGKDTLTTELVGAFIVVNYNIGEPELVAITEDMITIGGWTATAGSVTITYMGSETVANFTVLIEALSVSEFLAKSSGTYMVRMQVVAPVSSAGAIELIVRDVETGVFMGVYNSGVAGGTSAPELKTDYVNKGDIIVASLKVTKGATSGSGSYGKKYGDGINGDTFKASIIVESTGNTIDLSPAGLSVYATIDSQEALVEFLNDDNRFYKVVKITSAVKGVTYNSSGVPAYLRLFFDNTITTLTAQKVNGVSPVFHYKGFAALVGELSNYFTNSSSTKYTTPATTTNEFYALFVGGNKYYHVFAPLQADWVVAPQA